MRKGNLLTFSLTVCLITMLGCDSLAPGPSGPIWYANSFESSADIADWGGYGLELREEAPEGGGNRSAYVSGACTHPHAANGLVAPSDGKLVLRAWGKNLISGGGLMLENVDTEQHIRISVRAPEWTAHQSQDMLRVREGDRLRLTMSAGGFAASAMLVDLVKVVNVN